MKNDYFETGCIKASCFDANAQPTLFQVPAIDAPIDYGAGALDDCYVIGFAAIEVYSFGCTEQRIVATLQSQTNKANK